jgi:hypothetical protein
MLHHAYYWRERRPGDGPGPAARYVKGWGQPVRLGDKPDFSRAHANARGIERCESTHPRRNVRRVGAWKRPARSGEPVTFLSRARARTRHRKVREVPRPRRSVRRVGPGSGPPLAGACEIPRAHVRAHVIGRYEGTPPPQRVRRAGAWSGVPPLAGACEIPRAHVRAHVIGRYEGTPPPQRVRRAGAWSGVPLPAVTVPRTRPRGVTLPPPSGETDRGLTSGL